MRLSQIQINLIKKIFNSYKVSGEIYLHGSRIDDTKKGGDIDLFFIIEDNDYEKISSITYKITAELSLYLNQQKIDLLILSKSESKNHDFFLNSNKVLLK